MWYSLAQGEQEQEQQEDHETVKTKKPPPLREGPNYYGLSNAKQLGGIVLHVSCVFYGNLNQRGSFSKTNLSVSLIY